MRILIRQLGSDGQWKENLLQARRISLGRGTQQTVHLPGLMVALEHAELQPAGEGQFRLVAKALMGVDLEGRAGVREALLRVGDGFQIGGHQLRLEPPQAGIDLVLSIELARADAGLARTPPKLDLDSGGLGKRKTALVLIGLILLFALFSPLLLSALGNPPWLRAVLPSKAAWSAGPVSPAHAHFGADCKTCHQGAFQSISDSSCTECHAEVRHHADDPAVAALHGFKDRNCTDCHQEHRGAQALISANPSLCTDCHGAPQKLAGFEQMPKVTDFRREHPPFRFTVSRLKDDGSGLETLRQPAGPASDVSGSYFPHASHLVAEGVKGPDGPEKLVCGSCHVPETAKAGFRDLSFEKNCQRCHALKLPTRDGEIELAHAQNEASRLLVEKFYVPGVQPVAEPPPVVQVGMRRRIGSEAVESATPAEAPDTSTLVSEVFEYRVCGKCHLIDRSGEHPRVIPPKLRHTWTPAANFTHAPHDAVPCADCHQVAESKAGTDLNLPGIETCQRCHAGTHDSDGVRTTCVDCHNLHQAEHLTMRPSAEAPKPVAAGPAP